MYKHLSYIFMQTISHNQNSHPIDFEPSELSQLLNFYYSLSHLFFHVS